MRHAGGTNSHEYQMKKDAQGNEYEVWTKILPIRDWEALEKEWSDANSSENPGDVRDNRCVPFPDNTAKRNRREPLVCSFFVGMIP